MTNTLIGKAVFSVTNAGNNSSSTGEIVKVEDTQFGTFATVIWNDGELAGRFEPVTVHTIKQSGEHGIGVYFAS